MPDGSTRLETDLSGAQLEHLLDVGRTIVSELDLETVLRAVLDAARDLTEARYAALGILDPDKSALERFVFVGIDEETRHAIGPLPRGRGVLGELIRHPEPLRLPDVGAHPRSYGFPANHPPMKTFIGTPVVIKGEAWGNLYLTEKAEGAEFTEADESVAIVLAAWAAVAIENARLYEGLGHRQAELARAVRTLELSSDISRAGASGMEAGELMELVAKRARSLMDAETAAVLVSEGDELVVAGVAGARAAELLTARVASLEALGDLTGYADGGSRRAQVASDLPFRGRRSGVLVAIARAGKSFADEDRQAFDAFAISAATTIASVRSAEAEKLTLSIESGERERRRWARELHDETLQELGALRVLLEATGRNEGSQLSEEARRIAIEHVDRGIRNLQGLITELRPAALDDLGVGAAIETLARQSSERSGVEIDVDVDLAPEGEEGPRRLSPEVEATIYRLIQEAMNNAIKHADPERISVTVSRSGDRVELTVADDGRGFDAAATERSFGLVGMEERATLSGGLLEIDSVPGRGTEVRAELVL